MSIQITAGIWNLVVPLTLDGIEVALRFLELLELLEKLEQGASSA